MVSPGLSIEVQVGNKLLSDIFRLTTTGSIIYYISLWLHGRGDLRN